MYAKNPNPVFVAPKHHNVKDRPHVLKKCANYAASNELHHWTGWLYLRDAIGRERKMYEDRQKALAAMVQAIIHHLNLHDLQVKNVTVEQLADYCGLSTVSEAGNKSISRAIRTIQMMAKVGLIECDNVWDKVYNDCWLPKFIAVTPLFFEFIGIDYVEIEAAQTKRLLWAKSVRKNELGYVSNEELENLSQSELRKRAKLAHIRSAFTHRKGKVQARKQERLKKRLDEKSYNEKRTMVGNQILKELKEVPRTREEFERLINQRLAYLEKVRASFDEEPPNDTTRH